MALDYILNNTGPEVQECLDQVPVTQAQLTDEIANREAADVAEHDRAVAAESLLSDRIDQEISNREAADVAEADARDAAVTAERERAIVAENALKEMIKAEDATFRGTFNLASDFHMATTATHEQVAVMLASSIDFSDNNDYAFVQIPVSYHHPEDVSRIDRYKFNGDVWEYEYSINNTTFTQAQWDAINSGITSGLVSKLNLLPSLDGLNTMLSQKQNLLVSGQNIKTINGNSLLGGGNIVIEGGGAVGKLNSTNTTAQDPASDESFGGNINLHKVSKTGNYDDLLSRPDLTIYQQKETGKGLSSNDYTDTDKAKVANAMTREEGQDLQRQINEILARLTGIEITTSVQRVYAGQQNSVGITVTTTETASNIKIYRNGTQIYTSSTSGTTWSCTDSVAPSTAGSVVYRVEVVISDITRSNEISIEVVRQATSIAWSAETVNATIGDTNTFPTLSNPGNLPINYSSSNTEIATIDSSGNVSLVSPGNTSIVASFERDATREGCSDSYTLIVSPAPVQTETVYYGFANSSTLDGVTGLSYVEKTSIAGTYSVVNQTQGNQYFMIIPNDMTISSVTMDNFDFPMELVGTITVEGQTYKKYMSTGSDLGYLTGGYDFVVN